MIKILKLPFKQFKWLLKAIECLGDPDYWKEVISWENPAIFLKLCLRSLQYLTEFDGVIYENKHIVPLSIAIQSAYFCGAIKNFVGPGPDKINPEQFLQYQTSGKEIMLAPRSSMQMRPIPGDQVDYLSNCPLEALRPVRGHKLANFSKLDRSMSFYKESWELP